MSRENEKLARELRQEFFSKLFTVIRRPAVLIDRDRILVWLGSDQRIGRIHVLPYTVSPLIMRIHLNHYALTLNPVEKIARKTGWPIEGITRNEKLEISTLPTELVDFAPWVANYIEFHERDGDKHYMEPPYPCPARGYLEEADYAWTKAAETLAPSGN
jgi:hypothetical protein